MSNLAIIGAQWGDEGKGKIVDLLCEKYDLVVRYQGGNNAGHTVKVGDTVYKLHLIPSGIIHGKDCVLGNGMVIDPNALLDEMKNIDTSKIFISDKAHVIMFYHQLLDAAKDVERIGTTGKGIGPCYTDKISRNGIRFQDLLDRDKLKELIETNWSEKKQILTKIYEIDEEKLKKLSPLAMLGTNDLVTYYTSLGEKLKKHITDTTFGSLMNNFCELCEPTAPDTFPRRSLLLVFIFCS